MKCLMMIAFAIHAIGSVLHLITGDNAASYDSLVIALLIWCIMNTEKEAK